MNNYYISFRSVTPAQRGERLLKNNAIPCVLQRTPKWMEAQGCGYCLRLRGEEIHSAVAILRGEQVPMRRVFVQRSNGTLEEIEL